MRFLKKLQISYSKLTSLRRIYSLTGCWNDAKYDRNVMLDIEKHWKTKLKEINDSATSDSDASSKQKYYVLSMFPYPSGNLHMGHVRVYTISDCMARFHRLTGKNVIHPMGWDAFGLPAENAAIERKVKPQDWTKKNIANMREQLEDLGCSFDWNRECTTCDPDYYKWTQFLFLKMFDAGLVYQKKGRVNWDPVDCTVLADEQIDENGCSWRSGALAEKKYLRQWYIKTTAYSQALLDGLDEVSSDLWLDVIALQRNWIGKCDGVRLQLPLVFDGVPYVDEEKISVFTREPELMYGASHVMVSPDHLLNDANPVKKSGDGMSDQELNVSVLNPFTGLRMRVFVSNSESFDENNDALFAIPCIDDNHKKFAEEHGIPVSEVLDKTTNTLTASGKFTGLSRDEAFKSISKHAQENGYGGQFTSEQGRDWLISRQRYWGTPIPMVHCGSCGVLPVPYDDLPVELPELTELVGKGESPLAKAEQWLNVSCPKCGGPAKRETDTMDTFVDSSWYFLRYLDSKNCVEPFSKEAAHAVMPVDLYIGGKEHATMHLYYARFFQHVLHTLGLVPVREPFVNLLTQGMVMGQSYKLKEEGHYIAPDRVEYNDKKQAVEKGTGNLLVTQWEKMSKSKYNGVDPKEVLVQYGTDSTRLCILANVAPKSDRHWSNDVFTGVMRWQGRVWHQVGNYIKLRSAEPLSVSMETLKRYEEELFYLRNYHANEINLIMEKTFHLNTAVSRLQAYTADLNKFPPEIIYSSKEYEKALCEKIVMLFPFAPMFSAEIWESLRPLQHHSDHCNWNGGVWLQTWPTVHPDYRVKLKVKSGNREIYKVKLPMPLSELVNLTTEQALEFVKSHEKYGEFKELFDTKHSLFVIPDVRAEIMFQAQSMKKKKKDKMSQ